MSMRPWESDEIKRLLELQQENNNLLRQLVEGQNLTVTVNGAATEEFREVTVQSAVEPMKHKGGKRGRR